MHLVENLFLESSFATISALFRLSFVSTHTGNQSGAWPPAHRSAPVCRKLCFKRLQDVWSTSLDPWAIRAEVSVERLTGRNVHEQWRGPVVNKRFFSLIHCKAWWHDPICWSAVPSPASSVKIKSKNVPMTKRHAVETYGAVEVKFQAFLNSILHINMWSASHFSGPFCSYPTLSMKYFFLNYF